MYKQKQAINSLQYQNGNSAMMKDTLSSYR